MKYNIYINQFAATQMNLALDIIDLAVLDVITSMMLSGRFAKLLKDDDVYYWVKASAIREDAPILGITTDRGINKRIDRLVDSGFLIRCKDNQTMHTCYLSIGSRFGEYESWNKTTELGTAVPRGLEQPFQGAWNSRSNNYNTNDYNTIDNNNTPYNPPKGEEQESLRSYAEKLYAIYPAKDAPSAKYPQGRSTSKSRKDIDRIERILKGKEYTPQGLEAIMRRYISECSGFLKNLSTFLNNIPDYSEDGIDVTLPLQKKGKFDDYQ